MFHVTVQRPTSPGRFVSASIEPTGASQEQAPSSQKSTKDVHPLLKTLLDTVQFVCPLLGLLFYAAAFASENWIETSTLYQWGLLTKCQPDPANVTELSVICKFVAAGEHAAYFEASRGLALVALVLYLVLQFHFKIVKVKIARHQLPACLAILLTVLITLVLMLVRFNYSDDPAWKALDPVLGWSFWLALASAFLSLLTTIALIYKGQYVYTHPKTNKKHGGTSKIHPAELHTVSKTGHNDNDGDNAIMTGEAQWPPGEGCNSEEFLRRKWSRRLSPIQERAAGGEDRKEGEEEQPASSSACPSS